MQQNGHESATEQLINSAGLPEHPWRAVKRTLWCTPNTRRLSNTGQRTPLQSLSTAPMPLPKCTVTAPTAGTSPAALEGWGRGRGSRTALKDRKLSAALGTCGGGSHISYK